MTSVDITNLVINIAQSLSVILSVVFVCITVSISVKDNKKKNYLSVEVSLRMDVLNNLRTCFAELLYLTSPDVVLKNKTETQRQEKLEKLMVILKKVRVYYKGIYEHDQYVLTLIENNVDLARKFYNGDIKITYGDLNEQNKQLESVVDLCIGAYWGFIKTQSTGDKKGAGDYKKIFDKWRVKIYGENIKRNDEKHKK